jgi:hypothetical protein
MPTTTNYGWTTPADTDLVKDGAAAIRTLGSSIDTTVFNNASAGILKTVVDAKGDLIAGTASDTVARLAVGTNDQVLVADSTAATGLKWATPAAGGAYTLLSTTNLSGTLTTVSSISQSYTDLIILIENASISSGSSDVIQLRLNTISTSSYRTTSSASDTTVWSTTGLTTAFNLRIEAPLGATEKWSRVVVPFYTLSTEKPMIQFQSQFDGSEVFFGWGGMNSAGAVNSISIRDASGNPFDAGTVKIYGVK